MAKLAGIPSQYSQSLFSNNYLEHHLPKTELWKNNEEKIQHVFTEIIQAHHNLKELNLGPGEEANLEDKFIRPVLKALGYEWDVQPTTQRGPKKKRPDYALFKDKTTYVEARKGKEDLKRFFSQALTILEAKYWGRRLNDTDSKDILDVRDPTAQTVKYLDDVYHASDSRIQWAILTNGKKWRLFYYHATSRAGNFYEIDLVDAIIRNDLNAFKYFYFFFAKDAFIPDISTNKFWLEQHMAGSEAYATRVSEKLKSLIFDKVFEDLATGFIEYRRNESGIKNENEETLKEIFNGCLALLYRMLFLLYAESRNLLPVEDQNRYFKKSLKKLKEDIVKDLSTTGLEGMSHQAYDYWSRLESLCRIIDKGDQALNVPVYNGGLFHTPPGSFLAIHKLADPYLAEAIELLTVDQEGDHAPGLTPFIDYSSLGVRHLGDIYEGLLEFHVRIAEKEMVEVKEKGRSIWKSKEDLGKAHNSHTKRIKRPREVYIENIKHERRATGSYYTPHYIVEYIIKNTVGPILDGRLKRAEDILSDLEGLYKKQRKQLGRKEDWKHWEHPGEPKGKHIEEITKKEQELFNTLFDIKVLDPAMGSGHFLVHTVDFIADKIIMFLAKYPDNPVIAQIETMKQQILENVARQNVRIDESRLTEVNLIKRMVMKKCIHGVDINEMAVELGKLSLWLDSFTLGAPLSFLNHHLKCGNSLIGISVSEVKEKLQATLFGSQFTGLLSATELMRQVGELTDATLEDIQKSFTLYERADQELKPFKTILDLWISEHFDNKGAQRFLTHGGDVQSLLKNANKLEEKDQKLVLQAERLKREKRFFHWELEFPEVFYEAVREKENPGFDAVIGNPPYVSFGLGRTDTLEGYLENFYRIAFMAAEYKISTYTLFIEQAVALSKKFGRASLIVPDSFLVGMYFSKIRKYLLDYTCLETLIVFSKDFWESGDVGFPVIFVVEKADKQGAKDRHFNYVRCDSPESLATGNFDLIPQSQLDLSKTPRQRFHLFNNDDGARLVVQLNAISVSLDTLVGLHHGIRSKVGRANIISPIKNGSSWKKAIISSGEINRYLIDPMKNYINVEADLLFSGGWNPEHIERPKILVRRTGDSIIAAVDIEHFYHTNALIYGIPKDSRYNLFFLTAILNSKLLDWYYRTMTMKSGRTLPQVEIDTLNTIPIRHIDFMTPVVRRQRGVKQAISLYKISRDSSTNALKWVEAELSPTGADTVHDFLACLAEQMIAMNSEKQILVKKFFYWFGKEIVKGSIDDLKNKTKIKEFHDYPLNTLIEVLKENKCIPNPAPSKVLNLIEREFEDVMTKLSPLKDKIKNTDQLIDQIVFKLYGLTQQEIQIVEGL